MKSIARIGTLVFALGVLAAPVYAQDKPDPQAKPPVPVAGSYDNGYLVAQSADGQFKYWLDGRLNIDFATYQGAKNRLPTGMEIRRARIGVKATLFGNFLSEMDLDFADNKIEMKDMWVGYTGVKNTLFKFGNHKPPFSLDTITSSKNIMFIERAYTDAMAPDRLIGFNITHWESMFYASAGVYGQMGGTFDDKDTLTGGGAGTSQRFSSYGRAVVAPINTATQTLHLGFAINRRMPDVAKIATSGADLPDRLNASRIFNFSSRPESHVSRAKFLNSGDLKYVDHVTQMEGELSGAFGPLSFQSEYQKTDVIRMPTTVASYVNHTFVGYYGQVMMFLTPGDHRPYAIDEGEFDRVIPKNKNGAVEVGVRYSVLDLDDATAVDPILGGTGKNFTAGATYFLNTNHKFMFNVIWVRNNDNSKPNKEFAPLPTGTSTTQTSLTGDKFTVITFRYQIAF